MEEFQVIEQMLTLPAGGSNLECGLELVILIQTSVSETESLLRIALGRSRLLVSRLWVMTIPPVSPNK